MGLIRSVIVPRGHGKTTALIKECAKLNAQLVVCNISMVDHTRRMAIDLNLIIKKPITHSTYLELVERPRGIKDEIYLIDDVDKMILDYLVPRHCKLEVISLTI